MKQLNMTLDIYGGQEMAIPFVELAKHLAGREATYQLFRRDTGRDLSELLRSEDEELVSIYLDWVALRHWGLEANTMTEDDIDEVYELINSINLPAAIFIKSNREQIKAMIGESKVMKKSGKVAGVIMVKDGYIDTVATSVKGMGSHLILSLPDGRYLTNVSPKNENSLRMFKRFHMKHIRDEMVENQERGLYEINIEHG